MELEFDAEEWSTLTASERIKRCRSFAEQARRQAASADPGVKKTYQELSESWLALAAELESLSSDRAKPSA
jgi:hypothetical protein